MSVGRRRTMGTLTRGLQWPCRPEPSPPRSCHVIWRCISTSLSAHPGQSPLWYQGPVLSLPERAHAALCLSSRSNIPPHSHRTSDTWTNNRSLSKVMVRKNSASMRNSGLERHVLKASEAPGPGERRWAWSAAHDWFNTTFFLKECSEEEGRNIVLPAMRPFT